MILYRCLLDSKWVMTQCWLTLATFIWPTYYCGTVGRNSVCLSDTMALDLTVSQA